MNPNLDKRPLWLCLRTHMDGNGVEIGLGDIVKFGRCRYIVKELLYKLPTINDNGVELEIVNENPPVRIDISNDIVNTQMDATRKESIAYPESVVGGVTSQGLSSEDLMHCRICLGAENLATNPLISSPCKCIGSVKLIHTECLNQWLKSKVTDRRTARVATYSWKTFECDICKEKYPDVITLPDGKKLHIVDFKKPASSYMVLETTPSTIDYNTIHIISLSRTDTFKIVCYFLYNQFFTIIREEDMMQT